METLTVLVGTTDGVREAGSGDGHRLGGRAIDHLVPQAAGVWAVADGRTIWHWHHGGETSSVAHLGEGRVNCLLVADDMVLVGGSDAALFELRDGALVRMAGFDDAPGRSAWYTPWGGPPDVRSMAATSDGAFLVNVHVGGIVRSTDGGVSWTDTMDIHADVHQVIVDAERPGHAYAATARGLAVTTSGGETWNFTTDGLHAPYCRAVARSDSFVFVSASRGSGGSQAALYRRPLGDGRLDRCSSGLPEWFSTNLDTFCLAARNRTVVAGDAAGTVYVSDDEGATWTVAASDLPEIRCLALP